ncbi:MAG: hypothetical protein E6R07_08745 [Nevskiaceae bacterium]|nr:MAG: hypothetical protein E6R07_08745 [Nevskiaceae bacterium]
MKTVLFLVNAAPYCRECFAALGNALIERQFKVVYAVESRISDMMSNVALPGRVHYFSDSFRELRVRSDSEARSSAPGESWETLFSDFDRMLTFNVPIRGDRNYFRDAVRGLGTFFEKILLTEDVSCVIYEGVSNSFSQAAYETCRRLGRRYLALAPARIPGRIEFQASGYPENEKYLRTYRRFLEEGLPEDIAQEVKNYLATFDQAVPDYMKHNGLDELSLMNKYWNREKLAIVWRGLKCSLFAGDERPFSYQYGNPLDYSWAYFRRALARKYRLRRIEQFFTEPNPGEKYFLYPIHFHPEASTSIYAKHYVDELGVIKNIAFSLPLDAVLYVKEHPSAVALQETAFYRTLSRLPNVRLIRAGQNTKKLIRGCQAVVTLTSTVGYEAVILKKPVVVLGDVFYEWVRSCVKIDGYKSLRGAIDQCDRIAPLSQDELRAFVGACFYHSEPGAFDFRLIAQRPELLDQLVPRLVENLLQQKRE